MQVELLKTIAIVSPQALEDPRELLDAPRHDGIVGYEVNLPMGSDDPDDHLLDADAVVMLWTMEPIDPRSALVVGRLHGYVVEERVHWTYQRGWPDGTASPGIKRIPFLRRRAGMTREDFAAHWSDVHAPLARRHHPSLWRYVQNVVLDVVTPGAPPVDGIAELSYRSSTDMHERHFDSEQGRVVISRDVQRFIDVSRSERIVATEHIVSSTHRSRDPEDSRPG
jgi:uncharacterized protein (TIGR02118 family)